MAHEAAHHGWRREADLGDPDLEVQYGDFSNHRAVPLSRASPYPNRIHGNFYAFDPLTAPELDTLRMDAIALAGVLGLAIPAGVPGAAAPRWVVADPADDRSGEPIDAGIASNPDKLVKKEATGIAHLPDGRGGHRWVAVENVADSDRQQRLDEKWSGAGRDFRVCPLVRVGPGGPRRQSIEQAILSHRQQAMKDLLFRGPSSYVELIEGARASGMGFAAYIGHYVQVSGIAPTGTLAHELRSYFSALRHFGEYDQYGGSNSATAGLLARRILQIQRAMRRSPEHPDFTGLEAMMASQLDETGGVVTSRFDQWVAEEQKTAAIIMKNNRLFVEERDKDESRPQPRDADAKPSGERKGNAGGNKNVAK